MAKASMIQREIKRAKMVKKYASKRSELKAIIDSKRSTKEAELRYRASVAPLAPAHPHPPPAPPTC